MTRRSSGRSAVIMLASVALVHASAGCGGGGGGTGPTTNPADRVDSIALSSDSLDLDSIDVVDGDTLRLHAVPHDSGGSPVAGVQVAWVSSNPSVATVSSDGLITGVGLGDADITVSVVGASSTANGAAAIRANRHAPPSKARAHIVPFIKITPGDQTVDVGATVFYTAVAVDARGTPISGTPHTTWASSSPSVASIDGSGTAKARKAGTTVITATITIGDAIAVTGSRNLTVGVCSNVLAVKSWDLTAASAWAGQYDGTTVGYTVNEAAKDTAHLSAASIDGTYAWMGPISGTSHVNNTYTVKPPSNAAGTFTLSGSGAQPVGAYAYLQVFVTDTSCAYVLKIRESVTLYIFRSDGQPTGQQLALHDVGGQGADPPKPKHLHLQQHGRRVPNCRRRPGAPYRAVVRGGRRGRRSARGVPSVPGELLVQDRIKVRSSSD